ncbi:TetR/AcrR family transcriptional regulator [Pseudomonas sp. 3A(2025)]
MRYTQNHKSQTHQKIVKEASVRFRRDGIGATGLQPLMKALGLTHGGFYAHFKSKDDLIEQALNCAVDEMRQRVDALQTADNPLHDFIDLYLSAKHRDSPEQGCPLPTLCAELGQREQPSALTDEALALRLAFIEQQLQGPDTSARSLMMFSTLIGALVLARSVQDPQLSEHILQTAAASLKQEG